MDKQQYIHHHIVRLTERVIRSGNALEVERHTVDCSIWEGLDCNCGADDNNGGDDDNETAMAEGE